MKKKTSNLVKLRADILRIFANDTIEINIIYFMLGLARVLIFVLNYISLD